jgi:hypothetical protein
MQPSFSQQDAPGLEGPDYVALIIEWNDDDAAVTLAGSEPDSELTRHPSTGRTIAAVMGALGALALAAWGLRRLRAA